MTEEQIIQGTPLVAGDAAGEVLSTLTPLSFWGGYDPKSGEIIDRRHPLSGQSAKGRIFAMPFIKGSSTSTAILLEAIRLGTAPAALITTGTDPFMVLAVVVAEELFDLSLPVVTISKSDYDRLAEARHASVSADGTIRVG